MKSTENMEFFRPMWRRVVLIALLVIWAGVEFFHEQHFWGYAVLFAIAYAIKILFFDMEKDKPETKPDQD